jgi:hypothetical protein
VLEQDRCGATPRGLLPALGPRRAVLGDQVLEGSDDLVGQALELMGQLEISPPRPGHRPGGPAAPPRGSSGSPSTDFGIVAPILQPALAGRIGPAWRVPVSPTIPHADRPLEVDPVDPVD